MHNLFIYKFKNKQNCIKETGYFWTVEQKYPVSFIQFVLY